MQKKRGLGRSLGALLGDLATLEKTDEKSPAAETKALSNAGNGKEYCKLLLSQIQPGPYQPRQDFAVTALTELADSIRAKGVIQPILVRQISKKSYEIIAGERRFRAAQMAGLIEIPALIQELSNEDALAIGLIENIQREDLNPIEEAQAFQRLINEFHLTHEQTAQAVGKSRAAISNQLRLLALPSDIKLMMESKALDMGHARALLVLPEQMQIALAKKIVSKGLSVREAEAWVRRYQSDKHPEKSAPIDPQMEKYREKITKKLHLKTEIQTNASGGGKVVIHFGDIIDLEKLLGQFDL